VSILPGQWSEAEVAGHACHLYQPTAPSPQGYAVLYLQGLQAARLKCQTGIMQEFERHGLWVVEPEGDHSWWVDRISPRFDPEISGERYVLNKVLPFLKEHGQCEPPRIALLGASMGGQGALRLSYKYPNIFPVVAAVYPSIDFQKKIDEGDPVLSAMYRDAEDARQDTATLHIHPLNWPRHQFFCCDPADERWYESADRLHMKLYSLGVPHECDLDTTAGGHSWQYFEHMAPRVIGFLAEALDQERRRVV
jgi:S-formylglutathione hydrolase FrmB